MAERANIYEDIAKRCNGNIYIGVVGPVRTGKSTFIKKFMENFILPEIENDHDRSRALDEMPQSGGGKTVMTTEPKFVPTESVTVHMKNGARFGCRLVDCVGYLVSDAVGNYEDGNVRMVNTPWSKDPMPFEDAAKMGTQKVIRDHATVGIVITSDGTICDIARENYIEAETAVIEEMKAQNKPFVIVLNSAEPESERAKQTAYSLEEKYAVPVALISCQNLETEDIEGIFEMLLCEFPTKEVVVSMPKYVSALGKDNGIYKSIADDIIKCAGTLSHLGDAQAVFSKLEENENVSGIYISDVDFGSGKISLGINLKDGLFYKILGEAVGFEIKDDAELVKILASLSETNKKYQKVAEALSSVNENGYGIVAPEFDDLHLEEPQIVKKLGGYGVKLRASAPSIHMIRADIETEVSPMVGTEAQSEEMVNYLLKEFEEDKQKIWETDMFGKSLHELVNDGLSNKLSHMPKDAQTKMSQTLQKIVNDQGGGVVCILL